MSTPDWTICESEPPGIRPLRQAPKLLRAMSQGCRNRDVACLTRLESPARGFRAFGLPLFPPKRVASPFSSRAGQMTTSGASRGLGVTGPRGQTELQLDKPAILCIKTNFLKTVCPPSSVGIPDAAKVVRQDKQTFSLRRQEKPGRLNTE
jgi:hypothetical protein